MTSLPAIENSTSSDASVIRRPHAARQSAPDVGQNVGDQERLIAGAVGGVLGLLGWNRGGLGGGLIAGLGAMLIHRSVTGYCPLYSKLGVRTNDRAASPAEYHRGGVHVEHSALIMKPAEELYRFWRQFDNLAQFMRHVHSVSVVNDLRSHWVVEGPFGNVEWDAEIIHDVPNETIAWKSLANADVDNSGSVRFIPRGADATEVKVVIDYIPPAGVFGATIAKLFGESPEQQIREDLRRFKQLMETGEIPTTEGQPHGNCTGSAARSQGFVSIRSHSSSEAVGGSSGCGCA
jgi:uncharacterized membrane protein